MTAFGIIRFLLSVVFWLGLFQFVEDASRIAEAAMLTVIFLYLTTLPTEDDKR